VAKRRVGWFDFPGGVPVATLVNSTDYPNRERFRPRRWPNCWGVELYPRTSWPKGGRDAQGQGEAGDGDGDGQAAAVEALSERVSVLL